MNDQGHDIMSSNAHQFLPRPKRISKLSQVSAGASRAKVSTMLISAPDDHALEELKKPGYKFPKVTQEKLQPQIFKQNLLTFERDKHYGWGGHRP